MKKKIAIFVTIISIFAGILLLGGTYSVISGLNEEFISNNITKLNSIIKDKYNYKIDALDSVKDDNGNVPAYQYYSDINSRSIKKLKAYDNKIFMGLGDFDANTGPVKILYYNTLNGKVETSGTIDDEAVADFKIIDNKLYTTGRDPRDSWGYGSYYTYNNENNNWVKSRHNGGWIHVFDIEKYHDKLFICGSVEASSNKSLVQVSLDNGNTFEDIKVVFEDGNQVPYDSELRAYALFTYNEKLYVRIYKAAFEYNGIYIYDENSNIFKFVQSYVPLLYPYKDENGKAINGYPVFERCLFFDNIAFNNYDIYISGNRIYSLSPASDGKINFELIETGKSGAFQNGVVWEDVLYLLSYEYNEDMSFDVEIYATKDLRNYDLVYNFITDSFPYSIEYFNDNVYVGTSFVSNIKDSSTAGSMYKIDLNKLKSQLSLDEENKIININTNIKPYSANYEVKQDETVFKTTLNFNNDMTKEEWEQEFSKVKNLNLLYAISNNRNNFNYEKSISYFDEALNNYVDMSNDYSSSNEFVENVFGNNFNLKTKRFNLVAENINDGAAEDQIQVTLSVTNVDDVITSDKYVINEENSYIFIESDSDVDIIKKNINSSEIIDIEIDLDNNKLLLYIEDEIIREYTIARFNSNKEVVKEYMYVGNLSDNDILSNINTVNCNTNIIDNIMQIKNNNILLKEYKLVRFSSNKLKILNDEEIYVGNITGDNIKKNLNVTNAELSISNESIELVKEDNIIKKFKLIYIDFGYLNDFGNEIVVPENMIYNEFVENITINSEFNYKVFKNDTEITSGSIEEGAVLKIYYNNEEIDSFNIINEYLKFDELIKVDEENGYLSNLGNNKKVNYLFNKIYTNGNITITNNNNEIIKNGNLVGTGNRVKITFSEKTYNYNIIITGDVDGDGILSLTDINHIANHVYKYNNELNGVYLKAADFDDNNIYNLSDIMKVANKIISVETNNEKMASYISELYYPDETTNINNVIYKVDTENQLIKDISGNIRYYGADITYDIDDKTKINELKNYVYFNCDDYSNQSSDTCEIWRIIGVFDDKVKLMRSKTIGTYSWNYDANSNIASYKYNNNWEETSIKNLLNEGYLNNKDSEYYNLVSSKAVKVDAKFKTDKIGIKDSTRNLIADTKYNIGSNSDVSVYVDKMYKEERGSVVSNPTNKSEWYGKIGMPYASDYGYAVDLIECNEILSKYNSESCKNNWMKNVFASTSTVNYFINPYIKSYVATAVTAEGNVGNGIVTSAYNIYPVLYLNPDIHISNIGNGSINNPYRLILS